MITTVPPLSTRAREDFFTTFSSPESTVSAAAEASYRPRPTRNFRTRRTRLRGLSHTTKPPAGSFSSSSLSMSVAFRDGRPRVHSVAVKGTATNSGRLACDQLSGGILATPPLPRQPSPNFFSFRVAQLT